MVRKETSILPYFAHFADYGLYTAPPDSPEDGFGDLSYSPVSRIWSFVNYFIAAARNPYWAWWARQLGISAAGKTVIFHTGKDFSYEVSSTK